MNTDTPNPTDSALARHYSLLLGLGEEWTVTRLHLNVEARRLDLFVAYPAKAAPCPECGALAGLHDQQPERTWRHLDTMQFATYIHARVPRVACPKHGAKVIELPWAGKHSRFTLLFEAVDQTRCQEHARLLKEKDRRLSNTKYLWLQGTEHLSPEAEAERRDLLRCALETGKAWGLKEAFQPFWRSRDKKFARAAFDSWYKEVLRLGIRPMVKVAKMLKKHLYGLLAWFDSRIDNGRAEGYNSLIASILSAARGYRNFENLRTSILFHCGKLDMMPDLVRVGATSALLPPPPALLFH